jgi:hypothetical protein
MGGKVEYNVTTNESYVFEPEEDEDRPGVYIVVEQMPEFPGGDKRLVQFIADNIKYPAEAKLYCSFHFQVAIISLSFCIEKSPTFAALFGHGQS